METDQIRICDFTIYSGRNIYSHRPVMKMIVDIGKYGEIPTRDIPGFNDVLLRTFPGLRTNCCGLGYPGGFLEKLRDGTYLAHVLEHVILEMQAMLGYDVHFGKTRMTREPSRYYLVYEFGNEVCGLECGKAAVFIFNCFLAGEKIDIAEFLEYLGKVSLDAELGPSTSAIVAEAKKRALPITRIGNESLVRIGYGRHSRLIESTLTDATPCIAADISSNKQLTKFLLGEHRIPVPYGRVVYSEISAVMAARQIGTPVVVKPMDGNQGKGVFLNLQTDEEIRAAFREASRYSGGILVEQFVAGRDFRILVVGGRVSAAAERLPASITGDGEHTIAELVDIVNSDPNRGEQHEKPLTRIRLDGVARNLLHSRGMTPETVPAKGQTVPLRENGNLSTGGIAVDCTGMIHPDNAEIAVRAADAIGIDIAGIDIVASDITKSIRETGGAVVEVNTAPGIRMHLYPSEGTPRNVAKDIVDWLFPDEASTRFPIVSVTGTNGKTTVVRLIAYVLGRTGRTVGMTSTAGTYVGNRCVCPGDNSGPRSARALLSNKSIDAAVLETARGGIVREGLGYDLADVGVVTNIAGDHLGLDGIDTLDDLAFVKALVVEAVKKDGSAVLNARDRMTPEILKRVRCRPVLFAPDAAAEGFACAPGCARVYVRDGWIAVEDGPSPQRIVPVADIPVTGRGRIACNVENSLAAAAALHALGVPAETIAAGLKSFTENDGRFSFYELDGIYVMLDYGHNPAGFEQVLRVCRPVPSGRLTGVIGMPGDRSDGDIRTAGRLFAGTLDRVYIKEDEDTRGRRVGEVAALFYDAIIQSGFSKENATVIPNELDALRTAVAEARKGDLILMFYEKPEPLQNFLDSRGARKTEMPESAGRGRVALPACRASVF